VLVARDSRNVARVVPGEHAALSFANAVLGAPGFWVFLNHNGAIGLV